MFRIVFLEQFNPHQILNERVPVDLAAVLLWTPYSWSRPSCGDQTCRISRSIPSLWSGILQKRRKDQKLERCLTPDMLNTRQAQHQICSTPNMLNTRYVQHQTCSTPNMLNNKHAQHQICSTPDMFNTEHAQQQTCSTPNMLNTRYAQLQICSLLNTTHASHQICKTPAGASIPPWMVEANPSPRWST